MLAAKLTDKGQLVIPKCILHALGGPSKPGRKLGDWLPAIQVRSMPQHVDVAADVEGYEGK